MVLTVIKLLSGLILIIYIFSPVVFRYSPFIQRRLLFMNHVNTQAFQPEDYQIECTRLLRLHHAQDNIELGVWHILPKSSLDFCTKDSQDNRTSIDDERAFSDSRPVVLYIHGNGGTRAGDYRSRLYKKLAYEHDYHVVTFDYRGFGDSTYEQPTSEGLTSDARFMFHWLLEHPEIEKERIIVWGHSLGTAVAVRMVADLQGDITPRRLILEAPFDSVANAIANHPFSAPFKIIPYFEYFIVQPMKSPDLNFDSSSRIGDIKQTPIMILHAEDDAIIPVELGHNLYKEAAKTLDQEVKFVRIGGDHGLGHTRICHHHDTMTEVKRFIDDA